MLIKFILKNLRYIPKIIFCVFIIKPIVHLLLGLNIRNKDNLPVKGPGIIVANHNSHLDIFVIISLFPIRLWPKLRPIGAQDYFFENKIKRWFVTYIMDAIPISRKGEIAKEDILEPCEKALSNNEIIIIFPEGTRGEPEHLSQLRKGVCHLSKKSPGSPIVPIFLYGLGKSLPKGEGLLVPFFVDVYVNKAIYSTNETIDSLLDKIKQSFTSIERE